MRGFFVFAALLASCAKPEGDGTWHRRETLVHDGETREYILYEPARHDSKRPLVMVLHGGGGTAANTIGVGAATWPHDVWIDIADEEGLYVVAPQGVGKAWNDGREACARCSDADDVGFLLRLVDALVADHDIDADAVYVIGESNGGFMTQRLAIAAPAAFKGFGVVIALMPAGLDYGAPTPVSIQYQVGSEDAAITYTGGEPVGGDPALDVLSAAATLALWRDTNACASPPTIHRYEDLDPEDGSTAWREDYACAAATRLSMIHIEGGPHIPSSVASQVGPVWEAIIGDTQNHDVESARAFWAFFNGL